ncbi:type IV pilin-like G/H family protein [Gloeothece verrucosa]|uniref:Uncharacterized protein n=1 Tax=Gloeothece verrucosa (strain PCC 7822) TaxID=497965 RepID=E0U9S5_GLOV7|nr:type IV pilin-like G/H family protein [Gloeothece verrucosa]ADN14995.1 hypothetical protein Cyan7822_3040 [Gloeothece verrucosa PCC 7822]
MKTAFLTHKFLSLFFKKKTPHGFTPLGFLVRVFLYSGVIITLVLPSSDILVLANYDPRDPQPKNHLGAFNRAQQAFHLENGQFADSLTQLQLYRLDQIDQNYQYHWLSSMIPGDNNNNDRKFIHSKFMMAQPVPEWSGYHKTYIGAVFFDTNKEEFVTGICGMDQVKTLPKTVPILNSDKTIQCPAGSTLIR